jgi:HAMP domain-containing protein
VPESSPSVDVKHFFSSLTIPSQGMNLRQKISVTFAGITVLVGLLVIGIVYQFAGRALRHQLDQRATAIATNLSDAAASLAVAGNIAELNTLTAKYALLGAIAYVFIEDAKGSVIANSLGTLPMELRTLTGQELRQTEKRSLSFRGRRVQETRIPLLEGRAGAVHVGMWGDVADSEIRSVLFPIIGLIAVAILAGMISSIFLARWIIRPIIGMVTVADKVSKGNLDMAVTIDSHDEIGELARSLDRMRISLKAAMARINRP